MKTAREFPMEPEKLVFQINKFAVDTANAFNNRTISIFPKNKVAITGESWFPFGKRQQTLRQMYTFTSTTAVSHGLQLNEIDYFTKDHGKYTDGTNWYGLIHGTNTAIPGQITFYITPTQIVFVVGAGAPSFTKGILNLEWMSFF